MPRLLELGATSTISRRISSGQSINSLSQAWGHVWEAHYSWGRYRAKSREQPSAMVLQQTHGLDQCAAGRGTHPSHGPGVGYRQGRRTALMPGWHSRGRFAVRLRDAVARPKGPSTGDQEISGQGQVGLWEISSPYQRRFAGSQGAEAAKSSSVMARASSSDSTDAVSGSSITAR
jgi:hypothetical protein